MTITPVSATTGGTVPTTQTTAPKQTMDSSVFMTLLVTQLRNQDPSAPMDTNQMISQTTQLSMMEQLTQMSTTSTENFSLQMRSAAAALLGKSVTYTPAGGSDPVTGVATAVSYAGSVPQVSVGGVDVALDAISGVTTPATAAPTTAPVA
ncbi:MAG TPA: flagellar hook capping FlgD N-terminal domain-containing protein [Microbacteriaceae bacterium]|nr:flagellar hook capping FlgD N-terminal domain-containing protein [Microbacteriaceae bacterium]